MKKILIILSVLFAVLLFDAIAMRYRIHTLEQINASQKETIQMLRESSETQHCWHERLIQKKDSLIKELMKPTSP